MSWWSRKLLTISGSAVSVNDDSVNPTLHQSCVSTFILSVDVYITLLLLGYWAINWSIQLSEEAKNIFVLLGVPVKM